MNWAHFLAFNLTLLAAMAAPGPALLFAIRQSITGGFRTGLMTGAGLGLMAATWTAAALFGLDVLFQLFPWAFVILKITGAAYLLWIAYGMWRDAHTPVGAAADPGAKAFFGGILVNLANPKAVLFAASVLVIIFPPGLTLVEKGMIFANHLAVELTVYALFSALLATKAAKEGYLRMKPVIDRISALILGGLGVKLLVGK